MILLHRANLRVNPVNGDVQAWRTDAKDVLIEPYIRSRKDRLASEEISDIIDEFLTAGTTNGDSSALDKLGGWAKAKIRSAKKRIDWINPNHKSSVAFDRHRFPLLEVDTVEEGVVRFQELLGRFEGIGVSPVRENVFRLDRK